MTGLLGLADDLTGALEIGALFGVPVLTRAIAPLPDPVVVDTETRHLPPDEAARRVRALISGNYRLIYKKTDSTLRGNIGPELAVLLEAYPRRSVFYAPAYPQVGRTVRHGRLFIDGVPVESTSFANDDLNPVRESDIVRLLAPCLPARSVQIEGWSFQPGVVDVFEGSSEAHVEAVARLALASTPPVIAAGPGALAAALAGKRTIELPRIRRCLIVGGSRHPVSVAQISWARENASWPVWSPPSIAATGTDHATAAGNAVLDVLLDFDGIIVFGGDTAFGLVAAMGHPVLEPLGEAMAGIPVSRVQWKGRTLYLITKAGGFGPPDLAGQLIRKLGSKESK